MIIDSTYFVNKLNLPQVGNTEGLADVNNFIDQYEPEYLRCVLGNDLYNAFINGVDGSGLPDDRWLDLLQGKDFTYRNCTYKWVGFAPLTVGADYTITGISSEFYTAGGAGEYDPVSGSAVMTLPPYFVNAALNIELRGTGKLKPTEYSITGNQLTLLNGILFNAGTVVYISKKPSLTVVNGSVLKVSPIANYVFYQYVDNKVTDFTLAGMVQSTTDNNRVVMSDDVLIDAWNRMVDMNKNLYRFLKANKTVYPEWKICHDHCGCYCGCEVCANEGCEHLFKKRNRHGL